MKRIVKQIFSITLCAILLLACLPVGAFLYGEIKANAVPSLPYVLSAVEKVNAEEPVPTRNLTVIPPSTWQNVYIYTWEPEQYGVWPGVEITAVDGVYCTAVPASMTNLVISGVYNNSYFQNTQGISLHNNGENVTVTVREDCSYTVEYENLSQFIGPDSLALVGSGLPGINQWDPADPAGNMTEIAANVYEKTLECSQGSTMHFKFAGNDTWDDNWNFGSASVVFGETVDLENGPGSSDIYLIIEENCKLKFTVDLNPLSYGGKATLLVEKTSLPALGSRILKVKAPDSWKYLNVYSWNPDVFGGWPGARMSLDNGYYKAAIANDVLNLIFNGEDEMGNLVQTWDIYLEPNEKNVTVTIFEDGNYDVDYEGQQLHMRPVYVIAPDTWKSVYIADAYGSDPGTELEQQEDYYWGIISSAEQTLRVTGNYSNGDILVCNTYLQSGVRPVTIRVYENGTCDVSYDSEPNTTDGLRVVGNADWMGNWNAVSNEGLMEDLSLGFYQKCFKNVQPGDYEFKITQDGKWDNAIGDPKTGGNFLFTVTRTSDVYITCVFDAGDVLVYCDVAPKPRGDMNIDGKLNMGDVAKLYGHIRGTNLLTDEQVLNNADMNGDGQINIGDAARIYAFVRGTDATGIVDAAYELAPGASLSSVSTLTGKILSIDCAYSSQRDDIHVYITVEGRENKPILCYGLKGAGIENLAVGDVITVTGTIEKHQYSTGICLVQFKEGCQLQNLK